MTREPEALAEGPARVSLEPIARERACVLDNLFELYVHDFSEQVPIELQPSGRFERTAGDEWWTSPGHHPFLIRAGAAPGGFALVRRGSRLTSEREVMDVAEFFVLRGARRRGVGMRAAHALFEMFPARWELRVRRTNPAALSFWTRAVEAWCGRAPSPIAFTSDGVDWDVLRLDSAA